MHVIISYTFSFYKDTKCAQGHEIAQYVLCSVTCDVIREIWLGMESFMSNKSRISLLYKTTMPSKSITFGGCVVWQMWFPGVCFGIVHQSLNRQAFF